jgi:predicted Fe-Mo cluster-binding NifX family protein
MRYFRNGVHLPSDVQRKAYYNSLWTGGYDDIEHWLDLGVDVNYAGPGWESERWHHAPPVYIAVERNNTRIAQLLVDHGLDVNACEKTIEVSALVHALNKGYYDIATILIGAGADLTVTDDSGRTAIEILLIDGGPGPQVVEVLKQKFPDIMMDYWLSHP